MPQWIEINLPWDEPAGWEAPERGDLSEEERQVLGGRTLQEMYDVHLAEFREKWTAFLAKEGVTEEQFLDLSLDITDEQWTRVHSANVQLKDAQQIADDQVFTLCENLPGEIAYQEAYKASRKAWHTRYFSPHAKLGMIVETTDGQRFLLGHLCLAGGHGSEYYPLHGTTIARYYQLEIPEDLLPSTEF